MNVSEQGVRRDRHVAIPRTLIFLTSRNAASEQVVLLLRGAPTKRLWANRYNGVGGHVEAGENVYEAALRELREETGLLPASLQLRGIVHIDTGMNDAGLATPGVLVFVFRGESEWLAPTATREGQAEWIPVAEIATLPVVDDLPELLARALQDGEIFYGRYRPTPDGLLARTFS